MENQKDFGVWGIRGHELRTSGDSSRTPSSEQTENSHLIDSLAVKE